MDVATRTCGSYISSEPSVNRAVYMLLGNGGFATYYSFRDRETAQAMLAEFPEDRSLRVVEFAPTGR